VTKRLLYPSAGVLGPGQEPRIFTLGEQESITINSERLRIERFFFILIFLTEFNLKELFD